MENFLKLQIQGQKYLSFLVMEGFKKKSRLLSPSIVS